MNSSIQAAVMNLFSSHQQTTKLTILACSDSRDSWFDQEDARDVCPAAPWTRCVSGWRCVSAPSFQGRSSTTTKCVCGRSRALHKWCSAQTAFSPSTTPLDQRRPRMRCMSPAYSRWWRPWLAAITPPSSATDKQGQGRHTHWRGETWVGWRLARGSSIVLIDTHFKQVFGISFSVLLGSCFLATARLAHNSILRVLNTQCTVDWISGAGGNCNVIEAVRGIMMRSRLRDKQPRRLAWGVSFCCEWNWHQAHIIIKWATIQRWIIGLAVSAYLLHLSFNCSDFFLTSPIAGGYSF